uniref:Uncharacterized protein n=1 Tax=Panagrolaimus sp. PS1159 TaxID=55785 RepID=A0AC35GVQ4_9BILA
MPFFENCLKNHISCPTPRRAAAATAAQSGKPKQRKPPPQTRQQQQQQQQQHPSPDPKSSEAEASSSSAPPITTARTASTSKAKLSSDSLLTGATAPAPIKRKDATVNRRSVDFSKIVLEAARRASNTTAATTENNRRGTITDLSDIEAAGASAGINFEKIIRDRKSKLHRQPSIEEVAETESTVSIGSAFNLAKQHSLNSPRRRSNY